MLLRPLLLLVLLAAASSTTDTLALLHGVLSEWEAELRASAAATNSTGGSWLAHAESVTHGRVAARQEAVLGLLQDPPVLVLRPAHAVARAQTAECDAHVARSTGAAADARGAELLGVHACPVHAAAHCLQPDPAAPVAEGASAWIAAGTVWFANSEHALSVAAFAHALRVGVTPVELVDVVHHLAALAQVTGRTARAGVLLALLAAAAPPLEHTPPSLAAAAALKRAALLPPVNPGAAELAALHWRFEAQLAALARSGPHGALDDPLGHFGATPFTLSHMGLNDRPQMAALGRALAGAAPSLASHPGAALAYWDPASGEKLRIGFVSSHLRDHSIGRMLVEPIAAMCGDPALHVEVFDTATDALDSPPGDVVRGHLRGAAAAWTAVPRDLDVARDAVRGRRLHALVYPDVGMEPFTYLLAFARLAPVQAAWWGHPSTTGLPHTVDYFFSLEDERQDAAVADYAEQLVRFDAVNSAPYRAQHAAKTTPLAEHGVALPEDEAHVFLVLGRLFKLHPRFDAIVGDLLAADRSAVVLLVAEREPAWNAAAVARITAALAARGGLGAADVVARVRLVDYWSYVHALGHAHAVLDTFPYGGCLTSLEALAHGKPIVTLPADGVRGRFTKALHRQLLGGAGGDAARLVAADADDYVRIAVALGANATFREAAGAEIRAAYAGLGRPEAVAREWAAALRRMAGGVERVGD